MKERLKVSDIHIGVVGLGLMGSSIVAALLVSGHPVKAIAPLEGDAADAGERIRDQLELCRKAGLIDAEPDAYLRMLTISGDYSELSPCAIVLECVIEKKEIKEQVYRKICPVVSPETIIATNTSAIPISELQEYIVNPDRFLGIHWAEPAFMTRFLEITCGIRTGREYADRVFNLAHQWGKEPTLLKKDIRGFITNRLMYAVYREIFNQIENGTATREDVDKAFRYDAGSWMTMMGVFRRMDYQGLDDFREALANIFPRLSNSPGVPGIMQDMVARYARGVHNGVGLYPYAGQEGERWDAAFSQFNEDIHNLAARYSAEEMDRKIKA